MRIATAQSFDSAVDNLSRQRSELVEVQNRLSSLKRVERPSDDPLAAARIERSLASSERIQAEQRSVEASRQAMTLTESALGDGIELLQQAREAAVAAGNGTYSDAERRGLAQQLQGIREQLLGVANRSDGSGRALFGGGADGLPFGDAPQGVRYAGAVGDSQGGASLPMAFEGAAVWLRAPTGNGVFETRAAAVQGSARIGAGSVGDPSQLTDSRYEIVFDGSGSRFTVLKDGVASAAGEQPYRSGATFEVDGMRLTIDGAPAAGDRFAISRSTPSLDAFAALDRLATALSSPAAGASVSQAVADGLRDLDSLLGHVGEARSRSGTALQQLEQRSSRLADEQLGAQTERAAAQDLDLVAAVSDFQNRQTSLEAALKSYAMVQRMTLFQYIGG